MRLYACETREERLFSSAPRDGTATAERTKRRLFFHQNAILDTLSPRRGEWVVRAVQANYRQLTIGGIELRMVSVFPPVCRPNIVPLS